MARDVEIDRFERTWEGSENFVWVWGVGMIGGKQGPLPAIIPVAKMITDVVCKVKKVLVD